MMDAAAKVFLQEVNFCSYSYAYSYSVFNLIRVRVRVPSRSCGAEYERFL